MNEKPFFFLLAYAIQSAQAVDPQRAALAHRQKSFFKTNFPAPRVGLISAVGRDLQLKENTRLVPRKRMGLQLSKLDDLG